MVIGKVSYTPEGELIKGSNVSVDQDDTLWQGIKEAYYFQGAVVGFFTDDPEAMVLYEVYRTDNAACYEVVRYGKLVYVDVWDYGEEMDANTMIPLDRT